MSTIKRLELLFLPLLLLVIFLVFTDPFKLPLALLIVPFGLLGLTVYGFTRAFLGATPLSKGKTKFIAISMSAVILLLALMQSIRQLSLKDLLILLALLAGITFYMRRIDL